MEQAGQGIDLIPTALAPCSLAPAAFGSGAAATSAAQRVNYNSATGQLCYDSNGTAAGGQVLLATLTAGLAMHNADFLVI